MPQIGELHVKLFYEGWGIVDNPFGVTPDPHYFYTSRTHVEATASLTIGIECGVGFQALIAPPGMGKTTILFSVLEQFKDVARTAFLCQLQGNSSDLLRTLIAELGGEAPDSDQVHMQGVIDALLVREKQAGKHTIVIIDEAQNLSPSVLETVRLLSNFETSTDKLLHIILAGQPQLAHRLADPEMAQLSQRIFTIATLAPFDLEDTAKYVNYRLERAGHRRPPLFTSAALNLIWEHSHGTPRAINRLCFNSMLLARAVRQKQVDVDILQEVVSDFEFERIHCEAEASSAGATALEIRSAPDSFLGSNVDSEVQPADQAKHPAADRLRLVQLEHSQSDAAAGSHSIPAVGSPVSTRGQWQSHKSAIYLGAAALVLLLALFWQPTPGTPQGQSQLSTFEQALRIFGVTEPPKWPVSRGNPATWVWVDVRTGLYYCPGRAMYGKSPGGRFSTQQDAQQGRFRPANRQACP